MTVRAGEGTGVAERRRRLFGAAAAAVLVIAAIVLAFVGGGGDGGAESLESPPHFADVSELAELEASSGHPIYWAGRRPGTEVELTAEPAGDVYIRYLPAGIEAGDPDPRFLTVGTYPVTDAVAALRRTAAKAGSALERASDGGVVLVNPSSPGSVYLAYPGTDIQIEVYDPEPGKALELIGSGALRPVAG
jgi:hypothetical protein